MEIGIFAAFVAGVISFLSPCVLPLVPGYISMLSGVGVEQLKRGEAPRGSLLVSALAFVLGFTVVFVAFGASASAVGQFLQKNRALLTPVAGALVILFGLHLIGWLAKIPAAVAAITGGVLLLAGVGLRAMGGGASDVTLGPLTLNWVYLASGSLIFLLGPPLSKFLNRDVRMHSVGGRPGIVGGFLLGFAFAFGWTPCIGPILAGVLAIAATQESIGRGVFLLAVYSAGLAIPFLATALGLSGFLQFYQRFRRHLHTVEVLSGVLLLFVGGLIFSNRLAWLSSKFAFLEDIVKSSEAAMLRGGGAQATPANPAHANLSDAPKVTFKDLEGKTVKMEDFRGKLVLVNFWATWCGPCREEIPTFIEFQETYGPRGFTILGASMDEGGVKDVKPWLDKERFTVNGQKRPVNYPMVLGSDDIAEEFGGLIGMPTSLLISRDGKILMRYIGVVRHDRLKTDVEANLN